MVMKEMIPMPPLNSVSELIAVGASKCLRNVCELNFESVRIGEIAEVVAGGTPSTLNPAFWDGDIVWLTPKDLGKTRNIECTGSERRITKEGLESSSARLLPVGTILLSSRAPIGHLSIAAVPLCTNQGFKNIICSDKIDCRYLFHMLRASTDDIKSRGRGNTFKEITSKIVKGLQVPLPPPSTQKKIASFLDCLYTRLSGKMIELPELPSPIESQKRVVSILIKLDELTKLQVEISREIEELVPSVLSKAYNCEL